MTLELLFWLFMILWAVLSAIASPRTWPGFGAALLPWLAMAVLGWATFGQPVHD